MKANCEERFNDKSSVYTNDTHQESNFREELLHENQPRAAFQFSRMKEGYLKQKNNEGKVIKQKSFPCQSPGSPSPPLHTIERLEDAETIMSKDSPRSMRSSNLAVEESVIIMCGKDVNPISKMKLQ